MSVLDNKCPACGAKITFNPKNQKWDCEYCASKFTLEEMRKYSNASNEEANSTVEKVITNENLDMYSCKNCGAQIVADENTTATFCVYCGSTAILKDKIDSGVVPHLIIPFKNVKEDAISAFKQVTKRKPLMPKAFKDEKNIQKITGIYIPFWAYDFVADGNAEFNARDVRTWSDYSYNYTETKKYLVIKSGHFEYNKVLADASSRFSDELMDSLEPFNYNELVDYNHAYLSGFLAEKYDVDETIAVERARERTMNTCVDLLKDSVGHQSKVLNSNNIIINKKSSKYIMLPVWMVNINYRDKMYTFAMNGQTGKIIGDIPVDVGKTVLYAIIIFIAVLSLTLGFYLI